MKYQLKKLIVLFITAASLKSCLLHAEERKLKNSVDFEIMEQKKKKEIEKFASWFHQDWTLIFPNFHIGAEQYISSMTKNNRVILKKELEIFIEKNKNSNKKQWLSAWLKLGAQGWDKGESFADMMDVFVQMCGENNSKP